MKKKWLLRVTAPLILCGSTMFGAPCVSGTLQSYINLGVTGCTVGGVDYSAFAIVPGQNGATQINPNSITVTPGGTQYLTMLLLTLNQTANPGTLLESIFRVRTAGLLTGASVTLGSPVVTGDGAATGILDVCAGGMFAGTAPTGCSATAGSTAAFAIAGGPNQLFDSVAFAPNSFFDIFFDISVDGGASGSAVLSSATLGVNAAPEPSAILFVAAGIGAIGFLRLRRNKINQSSGDN